MSLESLKSLGGTNEFRGLELFEKPARLDSVTLKSDEFTALCPVTGQPDWYVVVVRYSPAQHCVESKSFKLYLQSFRQRGMFVEHLACVIAEEFSAAVKPGWVDVELHQKARGGVSIVASSHAKRRVE